MYISHAIHILYTRNTEIFKSIFWKKKKPNLIVLVEARLRYSTSVTFFIFFFLFFCFYSCYLLLIYCIHYFSSSLLIVIVRLVSFFMVDSSLFFSLKFVVLSHHASEVQTSRWGVGLARVISKVVGFLVLALVFWPLDS